MEESLVGRESETAAALRSLALLDAGPASLLFEGEPGIGKSTLWRRAVEAARERGLRVLEARPSEAEGSLPYAALGDLLELELEDTVADLPAPQRRALEVALLVTDPDGEVPDQRAIAVAVLGTLRNLAARGGVVVAVDDLQWLDADSARTLTFAIRRLRHERVLALLARRLGAATALPLGLDSGPESRVVRVPVRPLGPGELHTLLAARLGLRLARPLLLRVHAATGGNPLYGLEIGRALVRDGALPDATAALPVPETLEGVLDERLSGLSPAAREALAAVAALAHPTRALVAAVGAEAAGGLDDALEKGLVLLKATGCGSRIRSTARRPRHAWAVASSGRCIAGSPSWSRIRSSMRCISRSRSTARTEPPPASSPRRRGGQASAVRPTPRCSSHSTRCGSRRATAWPSAWPSAWKRPISRSPRATPMARDGFSTRRAQTPSLGSVRPSSSGSRPWRPTTAALRRRAIWPSRRSAEAP